MQILIYNILHGNLQECTLQELSVQTTADLAMEAIQDTKKWEKALEHMSNLIEGVLLQQSVCVVSKSGASMS